jgi:transposase InsO family protein
MLTDRGTEFCGTQSHEYEVYLAVEDIDHSRTKTKSPQTNGICERFHRTVLDEFYQIAFRKKIYRTIDELQADLDNWLVEYNYRRPHQGRWCFGKTPTERPLLRSDADMPPGDGVPRVGLHPDETWRPSALGVGIVE